ncbi:MAG TPA: UDP-N-acetylmuramoyl-L-alanine--D-glutamate ligase [Pirellulales bacterium]|jgi:UDP-N-acetylmuramoylalanine--D-glutamate ligase
MEVRGRRATVMGLGRHGGGVAVARSLADQGAIVTVTDTASPEKLADSIAALADVEIAAWHVGGHHSINVESADMLVVNPAVRPGHPLVERARDHSVAITSELELFLERCPGPMIGITGANGKSTTAAMTAAILQADGRQVFLGGNIGRSLLADLSKMSAESWSVLEISSFQLAWLSAECPLPEMAVLTSFTPNHLDWHGTLADYAAAKQRLFSGPRAAKTVVCSEESQAAITSTGAAADFTAQVIKPVADQRIPPLRVLGKHNRQNAGCAAAVAEAIGCSRAAIDRGLREFAGLEHRLEPVGSLAGRDFYNDSMATTPESTAAALVTFAGRALLMAGGYDKQIDMAPLVTAAAEHACGVALYGAIGHRLHALCGAKLPSDRLYLGQTMADAFAWCWQRSQPDHAIILSPGCASYDQFADYRARGEHFRSLVRALDASQAPRAGATHNFEGR